MPDKPKTLLQIQREAGQRPRRRDDRPTAAQRLYNARWRKARWRFLRDNPLCVQCRDAGYFVPARIVDHIKPHKGEHGLFWDTANWQALCKTCHDRKTATEDGGFGRNFRQDQDS